MTSHDDKKRILFLDAYDSFSNNIIALLNELKDVTITTVKIDDSRFYDKDLSLFHAFLADFNAIVIGPGPGDPRNPADIGLISAVWTLPPYLSHISVLGVCLGFQSLVQAHGGNVTRLNEPRHGFTTPVTHKNKSIFKELGDISATQYHSLRANLLPHDQVPPPDAQDLWLPSASSPLLIPLAWDLHDDGNGPVLMAVRHRDKPFWGVQYHPESISTNAAGRAIVENWWQATLDLSHKTGDRAWFEFLARNDATKPSTVEYATVDLEHTISVIDIIDSLKAHKHAKHAVLLESGTRDGLPVRSETGRFSIIGLYDDDAAKICYDSRNQTTRFSQDHRSMKHSSTTLDATFDYLRATQQARHHMTGPSEVPFWGGYIGYLTYEAGLETINVPAVPSDIITYPEACFVEVTRSIVVDHVAGRVYVQSLKADDRSWVLETKDKLTAFSTESCTAPPEHDDICQSAQVNAPTKTAYTSKVAACQSHIRAGDSYELCLTSQTELSLPDDASPWDIYQHLRIKNPAPFAAYFDFNVGADNLALVSSSPERFMSWTRSGTCQYRPIKGTVKKTDDMTREKATAILSTRKEQAENLMIVDLIRHDLASVVDRVTVPKLMSIEEYETVYQLVSVIEGQLSPSQSGVDVLAASLPPGSMTGAPKKRSCELLSAIEGQPRGLYSGVLGYLDVGGGGDFSVIIRSLVHWKDKWTVGAGGAVTALSSPEGEFEEMQDKRAAVLGPDASRIKARL